MRKHDWMTKERCSIMRTRHAAERVLAHAGWREKVPRNSCWLVSSSLLWSWLDIFLTYPRPRTKFFAHSSRKKLADIFNDQELRTQQPEKNWQGLDIFLLWSGLVLTYSYSHSSRRKLAKVWSSPVLTWGWVQRWPRTRCWHCRGGSRTSPPYCRTPGNLAV